MKKLLYLSTFLSTITLFSQDRITGEIFATRSEVIAQNGMVATSHPLASQIGIDILKEGGNAIDASIATQLALAVCFPRAGNIGGGGFLVASLANGNSFTIDHREKAPISANKDMFLNDSGNVVPGMSLYSRASSGVPWK